MEENRAYSVDDELMHYAKGQRARNHKYVAIRNGRYIYPDDVSGAYQNITETARRGFNTINDVQRRAGEGVNSFLNSTNQKRHDREAAKQAAEKARQERIQKALDEATQKAKDRKAAKTKAEKNAIESVMDPFRKVENARQSAVSSVKKEMDRQKKVHTQLKKERQDRINELGTIPERIRQRGRDELNFWLTPSRANKTIQLKQADRFIWDNERRAQAAASKRNTSSQRSSAMKEKSSSAHRRATSSAQAAQAKKRSAAKNKQRIANAKASRAR